MATSKNGGTPDEAKIAEIGDEITRTLQRIGDDLKAGLLESFNSTVKKDTNDIREILNEILQSQNKRMMGESQKKLQEAIGDKFGGSILGGVLTEAVIPGVVKGVTRGKISNSDIKLAAGQSLVELGKALFKARGRNG